MYIFIYIYVCVCVYIYIAANIKKLISLFTHVLHYILYV